MGFEGGHYDDELQEMLDGRLSARERSAVEAHVAGCGRCHGQLQALRSARQAARGAELRPAPASLESHVLALLKAERSARERPGRRTAGLLGRPAWIGAAAALVLVAGVLAMLRQPGLPAAVANDYARYRAGEVALDFVTGDPERLQAFFSNNGIRFPTRVLDLGMMKYRLIGGRTGAVRGRASAFFVYRHEDGHVVVCQMYPGNLDELGPAGAGREHDGIPFRVFGEGGVTLVFWPEGGVMCVLAGEGDPERVIQLAFAKAMKVA